MPQRKYKEMMKFLNSIWGSWLKVALTGILTMIIAKGNIYEIAMQDIISAAVISIIPIMINYLNPNDPRYGRKD